MVQDVKHLSSVSHIGTLPRFYKVFVVQDEKRGAGQTRLNLAGINFARLTLVSLSLRLKDLIGPVPRVKKKKTGQARRRPHPRPLLLPRERVIYCQTTGPDPLYHRDD